VGLATIFYCLRSEVSLFVASYDSQGYGEGILPRLHTGYPFNTYKSFAFYSSFLGSSLYSLGVGPIENTVSNNSFIFACTFVVARTCLSSCCLTVDVSSGSTIPAFRSHVTLLLNGPGSAFVDDELVKYFCIYLFE
jgi:hypothetical protein